MVKFLEYQDLAQYNCLLDRLDSGDCYVFGKIEVYSCKRTTQDKKLSKEIAQRNNITNSVHDTSFNSDITGSPPLSPSRHSDDDSDDENNGVNSGGVVSPLQSTSRPQSIPLRQNAFLSQRFQQLHNQQHNNQQQQTTIAGSFEDQFQQQHFSPSSGGGLSPVLHHRQQQHALGPLSNAANLNTLTLFISVLNALYQDYDFRSANPEHFAREPSMEYVYNSINLSLSDTLSHLNRNNLWESIDRIIDIRSCEIYSYRPDDDDDGDPLALGGGKVWSWNYFFYNRKQKKILYFACYAKSKMNFSLHRPYTHDGRSISASSGMGSVDNVYASSSSRYDSYGGDYGYGDDDDDEMEYRSNPKNQYFHTYPRGTGEDGDDDYAISYNNEDDDDDDEMMFDDLL